MSVIQCKLECLIRKTVWTHGKLNLPLEERFVLVDIRESALALPTPFLGTPGPAEWGCHAQFKPV